ncbi:hypothetical protein DV737_g1746, partial [Chaetothyriales sp. CBS 132003]
MGLSALDLSASPAEMDDGRGRRAVVPGADPSLLSPRSAPASPALDRAANPIVQLTGIMAGLDSRRGSSSNATSPLASAAEFAPPSTGRLSPRQHTREASKSFFSNLRASRSTQKLNASDAANEMMTEKPGGRNGQSIYKSVYSVRRQGSSPELPRYTMGENSWASAKSKSRFGLGLTRAKTVKLDELNKTAPQSAQLKIDVYGPPDHDEPGPRTAPAKPELRNRTLAGGDSTSAGRVGDRIGKAGKGLFGKITRSGSNNEREAGVAVIEEGYTLRTINLPLVQQTRKTRIARRLEASRDKTEFWMPALPWRCIDYLNMNGCEEEGLYRIPGSGKEVKHWQRRFDTEYDINLFEEPDLHDINTIGSMFKAWLRDLPDEILPKAVQNKVAQECAGATRTPQLFKDELSKLPPFNYYLLFAITCHLSLLTSFADKNRMDYRNLCICFQPCLKMDAFCFQFLVMDWKNCWQGCWTEKEYLKEDRNANDEGLVRQPPKTSDGTGRKSVLRPVKARSRSTSEMQQPAMSSGHHAASSVPLVPRVVTTPEPPHHIPPPEKLPELGSLSPIRM